MVSITTTKFATVLFLCCLVINPELAEGEKKGAKAGCGYRNKRGAGNQLSGGQDGETQFGEFPWMLAIFTQDSGTKQKFKCGASLIHPQVALTAAHCVDNNSTINKFIIRAGGWDRELLVEILPYQDREVQDIIIHPNYIPKALYNDVAMLLLKTPFDLAEHINVICLPSQNYLVKSGRGFASGWGKTKIGGNVIQNAIILKKIDVPIVSKEDCEEKLRKTRLGPNYRMHDSFLCAGGEEGKDTCKGDGGSPLVFPFEQNSDRYFQAGIVAWGIGCWESNNPGVYVNVAKFRNWIDEQMKKRNYDPSSYQYQ